MSAFLERLQAAGAALVEARRSLRARQGVQEPGRARGRASTPSGATAPRSPGSWLARPAAARRQPSPSWRRPTGWRPSAPRTRCSAAQLPGDLGARARTPPCRTTGSTRAQNRPLTGGTLYLIDSGGQYLDATTDITRTVALGEPGSRDAPPLHAGAQGPHRDRHGGVPGRHQRRAARPAGAAGALARRASTSTTAPGTASAPISASTRARRGSPRRGAARAQARHDPVATSPATTGPATTASGSRTCWPCRAAAGRRAASAICWASTR